MGCRLKVDAARAPGSLSRRVRPLLTGGNRARQQPPPGLTKVVQGCFRTGSGREAGAANNCDGTQIPQEPGSALANYRRLGSTKGDPECPARIRTRVKVSRTRTRVRSLASKIPASRARADVSSDFTPSESRKVPPEGGTFLFGRRSPRAIKVNK